MHYAELIKIKFKLDGLHYTQRKMPSNGDPEIDRRPRSISVQFRDSKNGNAIFKMVTKVISKYQFSHTDLSQEIKKTVGNVSYAFFYRKRRAIG